MTVELTAVRLVPGDAGLPLLLLGPSLGTSVQTVWGECAALLAGRFDVVGWELPGHGRGAPADGPFTVTDLARAVLRMADRLSAGRNRPGETVEYAGVSLGGAVGLQLALDRPERLTAVTVLCTAARIGEPAGWHERAGVVRAHGTSALVEGSVRRWFAPGFPDRAPATVGALVTALAEARDEDYAAACEALAAFDVRDRLGDLEVPLLAIAGAADEVTPPSGLQAVVDAVADGRLAVLADVAHLAPAEAPAEVAELLRHRPPRLSENHRAGMAVRRAVLGAAHVERASAAADGLTADFQEFITRYAWGEIWTRPGLARRDRSLITLTALVAGGHHEELALHVAAARRNGLSEQEITECLLQTAIYCGVPAANTAFRIAARALAEYRADDDQGDHGPTGDAAR